MEKITVRKALLSDAAVLAEIYAYYVDNTAVSFEYTAPTPEEFALRMEQTMSRYPYLVAEREGELIGYAYAGVFKDRAAYDRCVETTVYLRPDVRGKGAGRELYTALEKCLAEMGVLNLYACIAAAEKEDEYLSNASICFHECMGYKTVGYFSRCGYKFSRWYDMVWMEKMLGSHGADPRPLKSFPEIFPEYRA